MTQTHRFTEPSLVIDLVTLRRVRVTEQCNDPLIQIIPDEDYEAWLDERLGDQWELSE